MFTKRFVMIAVAASMVSMPGTQAAADFADGLVGGIVGGAVSGIIVNEGAKARQRNQPVVRRAAPRNTYRAPINSVERQQVREEQSSLNYFGFPAGTPDGVRGRNTRNAVSQFQAHMGYPATGYLADYERQFLISSYYRAQSSGAATAQLIAERRQGTRGLLLAYRDEAVGVPPTAVAAPASAGDAAVMAAVPHEAEAPQPKVGLAALPNLMSSGGDGPSLASHCNQISLLTNSNGGFVTEASLTDARFELNEQFCLARTYAIAAGEAMAANLKDVTSEQLEDQCRAFGPAMRDYVAALSLSPKDEVVGEVRDFVLESGQSPAQLAGTAKICLSAGYRIDNMDVALGSALLLTALGEEVYAEMMGHHLNEGFGTTRRPDLALAWYQDAVDAVEKGAEPVFAPGNAGRTSLIRKAAFPSQGANTTGGAAPSQPASTLPTFTIE